MENYNLKYQPNSTGININQQGIVPSAAMQGIEEMPQQLQTQVQDSYIGNRASQLAEINPLVQAGVSIPIWFAISQGMDVYAKKCRGADYDKTLQYKITHSGDAVVDKWNNSKAGKSKFFTGLRNKFNKYKTSFDQKLMARSSIYNSLRNISTQPELDMVKGQANGMRGIQLFDYPQVQNGFLKPVKYAQDLNCYGADETFIKNLQSKLSSVSDKAVRARMMEEAEFELLHKAGHIDSKIKTLADFQNVGDSAKRLEVLQNMKCKATGYKDLAHWKSVEKNIQEHLPDVMEALHKADDRMFARQTWSDHNVLSKARGALFGRKVYMSEFKNKLIAEMGDVTKDPKLAEVMKRTGMDKNLPTSKLGKFMGKYVNLFMEGATNRVAGGKIVAMMQAFFLAEAAIRTAQAKKGDKLSTFAERLMELVAFFACMPLAIAAMHRIGGLKWLGMTPEQIKAFEAKVNAHNDKVKAGGYGTDKAACNAKVKELKNEYKQMTKLKGKGSWITRPFRWLARTAGRITTIGLGQIRPYQKSAGKWNGLFRNPMYWGKEFGGGTLRFVLCSMAILPFISKFVVKGTHKIFGKPEHSVLDEGKEDKNAEQQDINALTSEEAAKLAEIATSMEAAKNAPQQEGNLLDKYRPQQEASQTHQQQQQQQQIHRPSQPTKTYTYIPSPNAVKSETIEPTRGYLPTPTPSTNALQDPTLGNDALAKSERAMEEAMRILHI